jgi:nucleotide-binding universal stress UspA family protein
MDLAHVSYNRGEIEMALIVLAAVDFGDPSLEALRQARALAHAVGGSLSLCHVLPAPSPLAGVLGDIDQAEAAALTGEEENTKKALLEHARDKLGLEISDVVVVRGDAHQEIVRAAESRKASYVVVGTHGRTGITRLVLGSVAERVARHAPCSVLVARPATKTGVVVAASDLSEPSLPAIKQGAAAATRSGARLVLVSVLEWGSTMPMPALGMFGALPAIPPLDVQQQVRDALKTASEQALANAGAAGEVSIVDGAPAPGIVEVANELGAELIVVGTKGRTGVARLALGSVAEEVIRTASCSVLVVR